MNQIELPTQDAADLAIERVEIVAKLEIHLMAERAREEMDRGFAFARRSLGQQIRWARFKNNARKQGDSQ